MEGDEGAMLWMLGALIWKAFVMIGTSSSCRHLYYHLFIVALGVMRQFVFPSKHINTRNGLFMTLLILYEEHEQTVWTKKNKTKKILGLGPLRENKGKKNKNCCYLFLFRFACSHALSITTLSGVRCKQTHKTWTMPNCSSAHLNC